MTKLEAVKDFQYDVSIFYNEDELWYWEINGGYCSVSSHNGHRTTLEAEHELEEYLKTFKPFNK
jgi:hypothetical protein